MGVPTERPAFEDLIATRRAKNTLTNHIVDRQMVRLDDHTIDIALNGHISYLDARDNWPDKVRAEQQIDFYWTKAFEREKECRTCFGRIHPPRPSACLGR